MYVNERDQINYHGFLRALREMNGVSQDAVAKGVCTVSGMNRFENGNRNAEKLMRDRLTSRLGISGEKYEDYLQPKEFVRWEQRLRIVKEIERKDLEKAKQELASYETLDKLNRLNIQFIETMRFMIMSKEGASNEELLSCISSAIKRTVPNVKAALKGAHLLADQEVNLIAEQMRLTLVPKVASNENKWRISEYEKLITYMENSQWEKLLKAKVYPKIAYLICQEILKDEPAEVELRRGLELCHTAIELLRDCSRLYYFIELTETRRALAMRLLNCKISSEEKTVLEEMLTENNEWENVFKELYAEYDVSAYMSDFGYLYYENESHNVVEVIENRRTMLGISRVKLSDGICTDKTIIRFEREGANPSIEVVRCLFERLGMCAEYRRTRVVTNDVNALMLAETIARNVNDRDIEAWENNLAKLKSILRIDISFNEQQVSRYEALLRYRKKEIDYNCFYQKMKESLECTIPLWSLKKEKQHFTRYELVGIFDFAFKLVGDESDSCVKIIQNKCKDLSETEIEQYEISDYELITGGLISYIGDMGDYEKSTELSDKMIEACLTYRRMIDLDNNTYNKLWNLIEKQKSLGVRLDKDVIKKILSKCYWLSIVSKENSRADFFRLKINDNE